MVFLPYLLIEKNRDLLNIYGAKKKSQFISERQSQLLPVQRPVFMARRKGYSPIISLQGKIHMRGVCKNQISDLKFLYQSSVNTYLPKNKHPG